MSLNLIGITEKTTKISVEKFHMLLKNISFELKNKYTNIIHYKKSNNVFHLERIMIYVSQKV